MPTTTNHSPDTPQTPAQKGDVQVAVKTLGAAGLTGASSLFIWLYTETVQIQDRLSTLETKVNVVLDADGTVRPSTQAMRSAIQLEAMNRRIDRLDEAITFRRRQLTE